MTQSNLPQGLMSIEERECTCHSDDRPPACMHRYAASDCQRAYRELCVRTEQIMKEWQVGRLGKL